MADILGRSINYLRLSVTDRCNLRCQYCMPAAGVSKKACGELLRYEDLLKIAASAASLGVEKIRVTGGEPLVRKGVIDFIARLKQLPGISEVALTTNAMLLAESAELLKQAGVGQLNVSLDSLRAETFAEITRGGALSRVLAGLQRAEECGLRIKLNMVVMRGINDIEIEEFAALSLTRPWSVRYIEYMPTIRESNWRMRVVSGAEILDRLRQRFDLRPLATGRLCGPARPYRIDQAVGTIGIISPMTEHFCGSCNRIRVTSDGSAKSCLMSDDALDLRAFLGEGQEEQLRTALLSVIDGKPERHHLGEASGSPSSFSMASIGG